MMHGKEARTLARMKMRSWYKALAATGLPPAELERRVKAEVYEVPLADEALGVWLDVGFDDEQAEKLLRLGIAFDLRHAVQNRNGLPRWAQTLGHDEVLACYHCGVPFGAISATMGYHTRNNGNIVLGRILDWHGIPYTKPGKGGSHPNTPAEAEAEAEEASAKVPA